MDENDFKKTIVDSMRHKNKSYNRLPEHEELLMCLHSLILVTGRMDMMHFNAFLDEATQLLTNSIFLYEDGLFDCAFYSVRQAGEVVNSMLYLSRKDHETLKKWAAKENFPMNSKVKEQLEKLSDDYKEVKSLIPDYFEQHTELIRKSHKIIHKQGFDTFYRLRNHIPEKLGFSRKEETKLFVESLKYTIGIVLIIFVIIDPISLALSDEKVTLKLNYNLITEPIDTNYFKEYLGVDDIVDRIKSSEFYREFLSNFADKEPMSPAVYSVIREEAWNVDALDEIEKQLHLLNTYERFMFGILKCGIQISNFYYNGGFSWYFTTIRSNFNRHTYGGKEFEGYLMSKDRFNQPCQNVYMSVIVMYEEHLFLEHNEPFTNDEIQKLKVLEIQGLQELKTFREVLDDLLQKK